MNEGDKLEIFGWVAMITILVLLIKGFMWASEKGYESLSLLFLIMGLFTIAVLWVMGTP